MTEDTMTPQWHPRDKGEHELRQAAAKRDGAADWLNEKCRDADVWVPGNMDQPATHDQALHDAAEYFGIHAAT